MILNIFSFNTGFINSLKYPLSLRFKIKIKFNNIYD